jgi:hypothetical protein
MSTAGKAEIVFSFDEKELEKEKASHKMSARRHAKS